MTDVAKPSSHHVDFQPAADPGEPSFDPSEVELAPAPIAWRWGRPDMAALATGSLPVGSCGRRAAVPLRATL